MLLEGMICCYVMQFMVVNHSFGVGEGRFKSTDLGVYSVSPGLSAVEYGMTEILCGKELTLMLLVAYFGQYKIMQKP